ncbi:MAG: hypothetical protein IMW94_10405 [Thermoanaerobacter sp.]|nr:hypothetical protein [Thermoanaerobacter sp.]
MQVQEIEVLTNSLKENFRAIQELTGAFTMSFDQLTGQLEINLMPDDFYRLCQATGIAPETSTRKSVEFPIERRIFINNTKFLALFK